MSKQTSKHTPGPWRLQIFGQYNADLIHKGTFMGLNGGSGAPDVLDDGDAAEWDANARLIAAAPDLLAALKKIAAHSPNEDGCYYINLAAIRIAKDVIAKVGV